ncbi:SpvB/TcaC N-terminal domain-containing protein [Streptomyces sp. NA02950]|uniref:SpvB/TcaC N-terminal domain-containing protein n=1 Tax=Streptomyces sp. NA02950 TaxID=2742137 RepID=UPI0020CB50B0|nr:SpvB/TcaC N-terminal domain-containing protein [Streptomyces sp. NA02950]
MSLPKGGGAVRGIGEKFESNAVNGTGTLTVPLATSPGRSGFGPSLTLRYDSGAGNGPFGFGWRLSLPAITRKTDKGLPRYTSEDVFTLSGAEDLVPEPEPLSRVDAGRAYDVRRYRPRIEGLFARIERWTDTVSGETHWRSVSPSNVTTVYGRTPSSRIADPADSGRVFSWLICQSYDDTGNAVVYEYKAEDSEGIDPCLPHERHRSPMDRSANRYLKRVKYGNRPSRLADPQLSQASWMFELVLDYGEHDMADPRPDGTAPWGCREDAFSTHRAGFEIRNYRLCRRVLMFHHFPGEPGVGQDCLTRSTDFSYREDPAASFLASVTQAGYRRRDEGGYLRKPMPPLDLRYSEAVIDPQLHELPPESLEHLPAGPDAPGYQWVDLDGEGIAGVLTEQGGGWFYAPALGAGRYGPLKEVATRPSTGVLGGGRPQLIDLAGDGRLDLVDFGGTAPGFHERTERRDWSRFRPFSSLPTVDWHDPQLRLVDLTGDGHADVLITEEDVLSWHSSLAEEGFGPAQRTHPPLGEEHGPRVVLADAEQSLHLADMSGDGLSDLVRIRNGEVCYWPSLGYGRFGAKVDMDGAPWFDEPDHFDPRRIRLADTDGSGTTDLIYLHRSSVRLYANHSGNAWAPPHELPVSFPRADSVSQVSVVDLLGSGTACLVWSSPLPGDSGRQVRYVDLMGGRKPHLLVEVRNNLGAETHVAYAPSTRFHLEDKAAGRPWLTRLPFPVQVVERVETLDRISGNRLVTRYAYHHGHFDGTEREFRGFGMVEQWDTESFAALDASGATNADEAHHVPPVLTRTWFHTGAVGQNRLRAEQLERAYGGRSLLPGTVLPPVSLTPDEERQACRALKGSMLRQEVYALDATEAEPRPYTVVERNYTVRLIRHAHGEQPPGGEPPYAVFFVHPRETLTAHHERMLYDVEGQPSADPRVSHELVLAVDDFGNVLRSASVGYGRRHPDPDPALTPEDRARQHRRHVVHTEHRYTHAVDEPDAYRTPVRCESRAWELLALSPDGPLFGLEELDRALTATTRELPYEEWDADPPEPARRLIEHTRTLFRRDDLTGPLPLGALEPKALPYAGYRLAFTPSLLTELYGDRVDETLVSGPGGYVRLAGHDGWWIPSGRVFYSPAEVDELGHARRHFFLPHRAQDPFGAITEVAYDPYDLLVQQVRDAVGNVVTAGERDPEGRLSRNGNDYRVLLPGTVMDPNRNRSEAAFDALGMVVGTAVRGKPEELLGDTLDAFDPDPDEETVGAYFDDPLSDPHPLLGGAGTRLLYDLFAYVRTHDQERPACPAVATLARETHVSDLGDGERTRIQHSVSYSDGFGREVQQKVRAEPGPLTDGGPDITPRWVGTGWTVFNNKGKPVRQYEPFFSATHHFEFAVTVGVSPVLFYDPLERVVATLRPDDTWEKVVFDPWRRTSWDVNDTVLLDPRRDPDVGGYVRRHLSRGDGWRSWYDRRIGGDLGPAQRAAAEKAAGHAATPSRAWFDSLGRTFLALADNGSASYPTRTRLDIEGKEREVIDALGRVVMRYAYAIPGGRVRQAGMEAGERLVLNDVTGKPVSSWNGRGFRFRTEYDALRRPVRTFVRGGDQPGEILYESTEYGEGRPDAQRLNLLGHTFRSRDGAGVATSAAYDFKGNLLHARRRLAVEYRRSPDWAGDVELEDHDYTSSTRYDALNRPTRLTAPDGSVTRPVYNEANLLERLSSQLRSATQPTAFVAGIDYNARGQRTSIAYDNGVRTVYSYDPLTFRLTGLRTMRGQTALQDLAYTYDPAGNITRVEDGAQQTVFFRNRRVEPSADFTYDALYRLVEATGREHLGQAGGVSVPTSQDDAPRVRLAHPGDGDALGRYVQRYVYDAVGNILSMAHRGDDPSRPGWTRDYRYAEPSLLEPERAGNRLTGTTASESETLQPFGYDEHGNITSMPELPVMRWDVKDQLRACARQAVTAGSPETTYYTYDSGGLRIRKVTDHRKGRRKAERISFGAFEIYREFAGDGTVALARETLHILDDKRLIALVETRTEGMDAGPQQLVRYQLANHLGSAALELDADADIISYEEYYPYGSTSYQAVRSRTETPKRYRWTGRERDEESGLNYHGARFYIPWLGRWTSCDPAGLADGPNVYCYVRNRPLVAVDPQGRQSADSQEMMMGMMWDRMGQEFSAMIESIFGGKAYVNPRANRVEYSPPEGGVGGMVGGVVRAGTLRLVPIENNPTPASVVGLEVGAGFVPVLDPGARLVTGTTVTGQDTSRLWAGVQFGLDVLPFAMELHAASAESRAVSAASRAETTTVRAASEASTVERQANNATRVVSAPPPEPVPASFDTAFDLNARGAMTGGGYISTGPVSAGSTERLTRAIENRMRALGIPQTNIGIPWEGGRGYNPAGGTVGGNVAGVGINVDPGVLEPVVGWAEWNNASLSTRVDTVIAHEWFEFHGVSHAEAVRLGRTAGSPLPISAEAQQLLKTFPSPPPAPPPSTP